MYQLFGGPKTLLGSYATLAAVIAVALAQRGSHPMASPWYLGSDWYEPASKGAAAAAFVLWFFGQTPLFPFICRAIPWFLPDIDGQWEGTISSNWPVIQARHNIGDGVLPAPELVLQDVSVEVTIKARLLSVTIKLVSDSHYSESETLCVRIRRDPEMGSDQIAYLYKNRTRHPKQADEQFHLGAGCIDIVRTRSGIELKGVYWTNRNWQRASNTAGTITLRRKRRSTARKTYRDAVN